MVVVALLALTLKLLVPPGFMPGTSLAQPIVLCPDQGPMPMMAMMDHAGHHHPMAPHDKAGHPCAFAGVGAAVLAPYLDGPRLAALPPERAAPSSDRRVIAPGRGMAAPPPPSHAPPAFRT